MIPLCSAWSSLIFELVKTCIYLKKLKRNWLHPGSELAPCRWKAGVWFQFTTGSLPLLQCDSRGVGKQTVRAQRTTNPLGANSQVLPACFFEHISTEPSWKEPKGTSGVAPRGALVLSGLIPLSRPVLQPSPKRSPLSFNPKLITNLQIRFQACDSASLLFTSHAFLLRFTYLTASVELLKQMNRFPSCVIIIHYLHI